MKTQALEYLDKLITDETTKKDLDIIEFIKKCVKEFKERETQKCITADVDWLPYFEKLWSFYPRKIQKELAKRTFEHKVRGLDEQQIKDKCNAIYKAQMQYQQQLIKNCTEEKYIKHYSSWLNAVVPNSEKYKGC